MAQMVQDVSKFYPRNIYKSSKNYQNHKENNIIGGEACLWTETADGSALETKLWPRGAALG